MSILQILRIGVTDVGLPGLIFPDQDFLREVDSDTLLTLHQLRAETRLPKTISCVGRSSWPTRCALAGDRRSNRIVSPLS